MQGTSSPRGLHRVLCSPRVGLAWFAEAMLLYLIVTLTDMVVYYYWSNGITGSLRELGAVVAYAAPWVLILFALPTAILLLIVGYVGERVSQLWYRVVALCLLVPGLFTDASARPYALLVQAVFWLLLRKPGCEVRAEESIGAHGPGSGSS